MLLQFVYMEGFIIIIRKLSLIYLPVREGKIREYLANVANVRLHRASIRERSLTLHQVLTANRILYLLESCEIRAEAAYVCELT